MEKKNIFIIIAIVVVIAIVSGIIFATSGNKGSKAGGTSTEVTLNGGGYKATLKVPATKENNELVPTYKQEEETHNSSDCGIANDKVAIELYSTSWSYTSYNNYKEKYGDKKGSYANYLEYLKDPEFDSQKTLKSANVEEVNVGEYKAIKQNYSGNMYYTLDVPEYKSQLQLRIFPLNDEKIDTVLNDPEVSTIINSVKIEVK